MNFIAMVIVARNSALDQVGLFVLAMSVLFILIALQDAMITRPYAVQLLKPAGSISQHAGSALALTLAMSVIVAGAAIVVGALNIMFAADYAHFTFPMSFGIAAIAILLREFARRHSFSAYVSERALKLDLVTSMITLLLLFALARTEQLGAEAALLSLGFGSAVSVVLWWIRHRKDFVFNRKSLRQTAIQNWSLGKWFTIGQIAMQLQGYSNHWLILVLLGTAITGTYGEAMSIVALANPFIYGLLNILMPKSVRKLHREGRSSLLKQTRFDMIGITILMALFVLLIYLAGGPLFNLIYSQSGANYQLLTLMNLLAVGNLIGGAGAPLTVSLQSEERGPELAFVGLLNLGFAIAASAILIFAYGIIGAGLAFAATEAFSFVVRSYLLFFRKFKTS